MATSAIAGNTTATPTAPKSVGTIGGTTAAEQQDRFMKLLVAQMKNQDPLNPMDNAQMTSQIAQINTVSGIEKLNTTVESLLASFNNVQAQSATQLPGRSVMVAGTGLSLVKGAATGGVELGSAAEAVDIEIVDANGVAINSLSLGKSEAGVRSFVWDGKTATGQTAPDGVYRIRVSASSADGKPVIATPLSAAKVLAVSNGSAGLQVDLGTAGVFAYSDIKSFL
ncbi:MAG: flagellar hook assembly protein FlgD [Pseudomonadota bacterium]